MGVVYRALDTKLDREVALKFLPPELAADEEAMARFIQEAKAASSLDHANICTIFQIEEAEDGRLYIAMALYSGKTLKELIDDGPVPVDQCISIGRQIASALDRAHGKGIVHRDIKSANIMLTDEDEVKILDFGLAKLSGGVELTKTGSTVGTAAYMSPEQVRSEPVDFKTDLWSLGIILYELLTGERPFAGEYEASVGYSILNEPHSAVSSIRKDAGAKLDSVINWLLAKDLSNRPDSAADVEKALAMIEQPGNERLAVDLPSTTESRPRPGYTKWVNIGLAIALIAATIFLVTNLNSGDPAITANEYSIAVLPFTDLSPNAENQYFGDGMAEELRNALMGLGDLRVAARASSFFLHGKGLSPQAIGDSLNVALVLEGTVRKEGNAIRVTAELTDAETGFGIWSNRYDKLMADVLSVQDEITREIVAALEIEWNAEDATASDRAVDPEAYRLYLQGKFYYNKRTLEDLEEAQRLFAEAIRIDSNYAPALAFHSKTYTIRVSWGFVEPLTFLPLAIEDARRAIELDPISHDAHSALGIALDYSMEWDEAMQSYERALELEPDHAEAHHWKSLIHFVMGELEEGMYHIGRASELDPLSLIIGINNVYAFSQNGELNRSKQEYDRVRGLHGNHPGLAMRLAEGYEKVGRLGDAISVLEVYDFESPFAAITLARAYGKAGEEEKARNLLAFVRELRIDGYFPIAIEAYIYAWLGEKEAALNAFEQAYLEKDAMLKWFQWSDVPEAYKSNPRMREIIGNVGLPVD